jgi:hypothetical protein
VSIEPPERARDAAFTVCATNYFAQALVLQQSFAQHHPELDFHILVVDRKDPAFEARFPGLRLIWVEDLGIPAFNNLALKFDVIELSTNVKPSCLLRLLDRYERVLYLDPDMVLFDRLDSVYDKLRGSSIVVTPAALSPVLDGAQPDDLEFLRVGAFNLGFVGVAATGEGLRFARWWSDRCLSEGFHETSAGVFVDQKWINLAPCYFESCHILRDPGVNMAPWNLHERRLSQREGRWIVNDAHALKLFHFSSFDPRRPQRISTRQTRYAEGERRDLAPLLDAYAGHLFEAGFEELSKRPYGFDHLPSGEYISPTLRRLYANPAYGFPEAEDATAAGSAFMRFARARRLIGPHVTKARRHTAGDVAQYRKEARLIAWVFALALRLLGPNRYFLLMRYLAHASSIRRQPKL